ncbi:MarR family winged helix-turn-helix transcriptional regulator [Sorangium sp. So ce1335]|uniref:MarR family winged helix-turn-helix transcriptional regulator n=1 Tax=Sorangium sp. So ce1335 TaxID=3133335 RepID=UPI003F5D8B57
MFEHCLYFNTTALARLLEREWAEAFKPFDLTPPQAFLLRVVLEEPGLLQREIADRMTISRPTATRAIDGLQAKGLVERRASARDGREWEIHPKPKAVALKAAINEASGAVTARLKKVLGAGEFSDTVARVRHVRSALR